MKISAARLKQLEARGAKVNRKPATLHLPSKGEEKQVEAPGQEDKAIDSAMMVMERITDQLANLTIDQVEKLAMIMLDIEKERSKVLLEIAKEQNKPKEAIVHRDETGDRLINKVTFQAL